MPVPFWCVSVAMGILVLIGSAILAWHTVSRLRFVREGMRHGDYKDHHSVAVRNTSKTATITKPVVKIVSSYPVIANIPIILHMKDSEVQPNIHPDGVGIFDLVRVENSKWYVVGEHSESTSEIAACDYEMELVAAADNCQSTDNQKVSIKNIDGKPCIDLLPPV